MVSRHSASVYSLLTWCPAILLLLALTLLANTEQLNFLRLPRSAVSQVPRQNLTSLTL
jgi:hypothetical protein